MQRSIHEEKKTMIIEAHWKNLDRANREMASGLEKLRKVQAQDDTQEVKRAEMAYLQALQGVYDAAGLAVSAYSIPLSTR